MNQYGTLLSKITKKDSLLRSDYDHLPSGFISDDFKFCILETFKFTKKTHHYDQITIIFYRVYSPMVFIIFKILDSNSGKSRSIVFQTISKSTEK